MIGICVLYIIGDDLSNGVIKLHDSGQMIIESTSAKMTFLNNEALANKL